MATPPLDAAAVRLHLKCPDAENFVERFAPNVTRGGIFLPTHDARAVGASIRFEIALLDDTVVLAGEGVVTWAKPKGIGVKFTTLDPASAPMLERLLSRRQTAAAAAAPPGPVVPPAPPPKRSVPARTSLAPAAAQTKSPPPAPVPLPDPLPGSRGEGIADRFTPPQGSPGPAAAEASPAPPPPRTPWAVAVISTPAIAQALRRPVVRAALAGSAVFAGVAIVWMSVGRARVGPSASTAPAKTAAAEIAPPRAAEPVVAIAAPPPPSAPEPSDDTPAAPTVAPPPVTAAAEPPTSARPGSLRVERMLVGASYKKFTCPNPTRRLSVRSTRTVNVCLEVAHKPGRTDRLTLVWERNGAFSGKTRMQIPASKPSIRTRAHMKLSANRLGPWSVRVMSARNAPLAQASFDVVP